MTTFFLIIIGFSLTHFVYQGILLPSIRLDLRFRLFERRDELRRLKYERGDEFDDMVFSYLQGSINNSLKLLHGIDYSFLKDTNRLIQRNEGLKRRIMKRKQKLMQCGIPEVIQIGKDIQDLTFRACAANNGGILFYLVPIALALVVLESLKEQLKNLLYFPEKEFDDILVPA